MSTIAQIRTAVETVLGTVSDIKSKGGYPPDNVGALPCGFCGLASKDISYAAGLKENNWTLSIVVLVDRVPDMLTPELKAIETLMEAVELAFETNCDLNDTVSIAMLSRIQEDTIDIARVPYIGFIATLDVTDKYEKSLTP